MEVRTLVNEGEISSVRNGIEKYMRLEKSDIIRMNVREGVSTRCEAKKEWIQTQQSTTFKT